MLFETSKGAVFFRLYSLQIMMDYKRRKREGAGNFSCADILTESFYKKYRRKRETSTIVDVDDKNCLAQLTVVLNLNHGVRQ